MTSVWAVLNPADLGRSTGKCRGGKGRVCDKYGSDGHVYSHTLLNLIYILLFCLIDRCN